MFRAFLDTCVLFKPLLCDTLPSIAEDGVFQPLWSRHVLESWKETYCDMVSGNAVLPTESPR